MFKDDVVVITGAGQGIGANIAKDFAAEGAKVVIIDYNEDSANQVAKEINEKGKVLVYQADVANFDRAKNIVDSVIEEFGKIDVLINNAGVTQDSSFKKMKKDQWDRVINTNLTGAFNYTKHVFSHMLEAGYGRIINVSSLAGITGNFGQANYAASKSGLHGFTKTVAIEGASKGITANIVAPGFIETPMTNAIPTKIKNNMISSIPVKRIGQAKDITNAMKFLASKESSYITGQILQVNGGMDM